MTGSAYTLTRSTGAATSAAASAVTPTYFADWYAPVALSNESPAVVTHFLAVCDDKRRCVA